MSISKKETIFSSKLKFELNESLFQKYAEYSDIQIFKFKS